MNIRTAALLAAMLLLPGLALAEPLTLPDLYKMALERAERVKMSQEDINAAQAALDKAKASYLPRAIAFANYTRYSESQRAANGAYLQPEGTLTYGARLDQSLFISGRESAQRDAASAALGKSRQDYDSAREGYLYSVTTAYYDALRAQKGLGIARANLDRLSAHRDATTKRLKVGEVTKTDLLRAEAELSGAQYEYTKAENGVRLTGVMLARLVGAEGQVELSEPTSSQPTDVPLEELIARALQERSDIKSATLALEASRAQQRLARALHMPTLAAEAQHTEREDSPSGITVLDRSTYAGLKLSVPLYEGGLRKADADEAAARARRAELALADLKKSARTDVESAWLDVSAQRGLITSSQNQHDFARENYEAVSRKYEVGLANSTDVIDANTILITAQQRLADARFGYEVALAKLERATGALLNRVPNNGRKQ